MARFFRGVGWLALIAAACVAGLAMQQCFALSRTVLDDGTLVLWEGWPRYIWGLAGALLPLVVAVVAAAFRLLPDIVHGVLMLGTGFGASVFVFHSFDSGVVRIDGSGVAVSDAGWHGNALRARLAYDDIDYLVERTYTLWKVEKSDKPGEPQVIEPKWLRWSRLFGQVFRLDKWIVCRV